VDGENGRIYIKTGCEEQWAVRGSCAVSGLGANGVEPSGFPATVLVEDHGFRRASIAAMVPGCCMAM
jgi:hypothetical protein